MARRNCDRDPVCYSELWWRACRRRAYNHHRAFRSEHARGSRVVTALSYNADGNVFVVSYGWQSYASTAYSTQAVLLPSSSTDAATANPTAIIAAITKLAGQGHIMTAMGGSLRFPRSA